MKSLTKAVRPLLSLGLLGFACAAQSGAAQAQGGLNDFFSQLFAPPPQPSYVQPLVVPRVGTWRNHAAPSPCLPLNVVTSRAQRPLTAYAR